MKKRLFLIILFGALVLWHLGFGNCLSAQEKTLRIYGPEGPFVPMTECAEMFSRIYGVKAEVLTGPGTKWMAKAKEEADIVYEETEHSLTHFMMRHPWLVDKSSRTSLYAQPVGILVRKGNPKGIKSLEDLTNPTLYLLDVNGEGSTGLWEDGAGKKGLIPGIQKRIAITVETSADAIENWKIHPALDAWITFESWHYRMKDLTDLVKLPKEEKTYRGTAAVATQFYKNREAARKFLEFLKTPDCQAVFNKWGWE